MPLKLIHTRREGEREKPNELHCQPLWAQSCAARANRSPFGNAFFSLVSAARACAECVPFTAEQVFYAPRCIRVHSVHSRMYNVWLGWHTISCNCYWMRCTGEKSTCSIDDVHLQRAFLHEHIEHRWHHFCLWSQVLLIIILSLAGDTYMSERVVRFFIFFFSFSCLFLFLSLALADVHRTHWHCLLLGVRCPQWKMYYLFCTFSPFIIICSSFEGVGFGIFLWFGAWMNVRARVRARYNWPIWDFMQKRNTSYHNNVQQHVGSESAAWVVSAWMCERVCPTATILQISFSIK